MDKFLGFILRLSMILGTASFAGAQWPPDSCGCAQWHYEHVEAYGPCASNIIVQVTRYGDAHSINFMQFLNLLNKNDSTTYVIAADTAPYILGCRNITIGGRRCVMVRGATGRREDVVLAGLDPRLSPDFWKSAEYDGPSPCGIGSFIQTQDVDHFVIADLSIVNSPGKMVKIDGAAGYFGKNIILHNVELRDCGSQMVKGAATTGAISSRNCIVECSYLHYSDALFSESSYETQGIDIHEGKHWTIRYNFFRNFRQGNWGNSNNSDAILMWDYTDSVLVEGNLIVNCNMGVRLASPGSGGDYMWAHNNVIVASDPDPRFSYRDCIEVGSSASHGWVCHNTMWNPEGNSLVSCYNQLPVMNNLYYNGVFSHGCNARNNTQVQDASAFSDVDAFDFHPKSDFSVPRVSEVPEDLEGRVRQIQTAAGAYEFSPDAIEQAVNIAGSGILVSPNPFNATIRIEGAGPAEIEIFDAHGTLVKRMRAPSVWDANNAPAGIYIVRCFANGAQYSKRIALVR